MKKIAVFILCAFFLSLFNPLAVSAEGKSPANNLTIQEAVELALKNSRTLQSAEYDIERAEELRKSASDNVKFTPTGPTTTAASMAFTGLVAADIGWNMKKRSMTIEEDKIVLNVINTYLDVIIADQNLIHAQKTADKAQHDYWIATLFKGVGTISDSDIIMAQKSCDITKKAVDNAKIDLQRATYNLNNALGVNSESVWILTEEPEYSTFELIDLDAEINKVIKQSPAIWLAEQNINMANLQLDLHSWNDPMSEPYRAKQIDIVKAELSAAENKEQMRSAVRKIYTAIKQTEEAIELRKNERVIAEEKLRVEQIRYDAGMSTLTNVKEAELNLQTTEKTIKHLEYEHTKLKLTFEKPWASM